MQILQNNILYVMFETKQSSILGIVSEFRF